MSMIIQLIDFPDELLLIIFKKLHNVELLYTLMGVDARLDKIISDSIFTENLVLLKHISHDRICPFVDTELDRICSQILPQIHYKINFLNLESLSMEHILLAADYPNLYGLSLYNIDDQIAERVFNGKIFHFGSD